MTSEAPPGGDAPAGNGRSIAARLVARPVDQELKASFLDYAMSVIVARALPDVRDGLKPVHRRVLYAMNELGVRSDRPRRKSALIVGEVMGKFHPHGDLAIYDTLVRMAQDFSLRDPLVDGQGNFGCFTGETKIQLLDGTEPTLEELARRPLDDPFYVYSVNREGQIVVGRARHSRITRRAAPLVEVELDNGARVRCTPDHRFLLRDGTYKAAERLGPQDSLFPGYFDSAPVREGMNDYLRVLQPRIGEYEFVHHLADRYNAERGVARAFHGPYVRHHRNFNRWDNRPENLERLDFLEHLHLHARQVKELWKDPAFRSAQRKGASERFLRNPKARIAAQERVRRRNRDPAFRAENGPKVARALRARYAADPDARTEISRRMRDLWADEEYRGRMRRALAGVAKRPPSAETRARVARIVSEKSRAMWANPRKRAAIVAALTRVLCSEAVREKLRRSAKAKWQDPIYRSKYPTDHFAKMAKALWARESTRDLHRSKIAGQWNDEAFRARQREGVRQSNRRRIETDPELPRRLAANASAALRQKWTTKEHRRRVMRSKIAGYGRRLLARVPRADVTPESYDRNRDANWIPRASRVTTYFDSFEEFLDRAQAHNHRVVAVRSIPDTADVYDITVDEHHNFLLAAGVFVHNSVDGDNAAAMRYTEARLASIAEELLADLDKDTVDFVPNYDASLQEPTVLPSKFPNLLVNGSSGIAVGMATNMPPHNLGEVIDATVHLIDHPDAGLGDLLHHVKGPDFPTGGILMGRAGLIEAYSTGRGKLAVRGRVETEPLGKDRQSLIVRELPYQVNKANLLVDVAELVKDKRIEGISDLRDESDRDGMRVVIELKRDADADVVLNQLYAHTQMQATFGVLNIALVRQRPVTLGLKRLLEEFVEHRVVVVTRRTRFELRKAEERAHVLEGLLIALDHIDEVVRLIRTSRSVDEAQTRLIATFALTEVQAKAILDMRLGKLAALEVEQVKSEHAELVRKIAEYRRILGARQEVLAVLKAELAELKSRYATPRRTEVVETEAEEIHHEALITEHDVVVTITNAGYIKRIPLAGYRAQGRGGKGVIGTEVRDEDAVIDLWTTSTHNYLMFFTTHGRCFWLKAYAIPEGTRYSRGKAIVNLLPALEPGERVTAAIPVREFADDRFVFFATKRGTVKRTVLSDFKNVRAAGIRAITLDEGDEVLAVALTDGRQDLVLAKASGKAVRFKEEEVRAMGRTATGVVGVDLEQGTRGAVLAAADEVVALAHVAGDEGDLLTLKSNGRGKRTPVADYPVKHRGTMGVITIDIEEVVDGQTVQSPVVGMVHVRPGDEIMVSTEKGVVIRVPVDEIPQKGRAAQGNWIIRPEPGDRVVAVARVAREVEAASTPAADPGAATH